ncbi:Target of EGR1 protein 1 [Smittium culicis]|uniref:Target of EGR1 protein 1 n=1 Tax=Smittium culicis TaxID=133412 RepID=A0A1R1YB04_9FUNG|nr:Target of EGR1 protein 1 [Smittium culicis]
MRLLFISTNLLLFAIYRDISERYKALKLLASTHSLVSLGISIFKQKNIDPSTQNNQNNPSFIANNFNFILFCQNSHLVSPSSIEFLATNGFDFNFQAKNGIRISCPPKQPSSIDPPNDKDTHPKQFTQKRKLPASAGSLSNNSNIEPTPDNRIIRDIVLQCFTCKAPIIVHNGLLDLMFLYNSFIAELPDSIDSFVADLADFLGSPIYDTKYFAEYVYRSDASFLSYLYQSSIRNTKKNKLEGLPFITIDIKDKIPLENLLSVTPATSIPRSANSTPTTLKIPQKPNNSPPYCSKFASFGYCPTPSTCKLSHDLDFILDYKESSPEQQKQIRAITNSKNSQLSANSAAPSNLKACQISPASPASQSYHSAVFDAYMTGYLFLSNLYSKPDLADPLSSLESRANSSSPAVHLNSLHSTLVSNAVPPEPASTFATQPAAPSSAAETPLNPHKYKNKIFLIGKNFPLHIEHSNFAKNSAQYVDFKSKRPKFV